eukprot:gene6199-7721_t
MSSSSFTLKILRADNGAVYEIPVNPSVLVSTIKESLSPTLNLQTSEQILLAESNLHSNRTLESYNITKDREIFLFNKRIIDNTSLMPDEVNLSLVDFMIPKRPSPKNLKELETSGNPLNRLYTLEFYLNNHVMGVHYIKDIFEKKLLQCQNSQNELFVQKRAIGAALVNLGDYRDKLVSHYNNLLNSKKNSQNYESLLLSFESDLNRLKQIKLHESLRGPNRHTLADCIPELDLRKWYEQCKRDYETLKNRLSELDFHINFLKDSVDNEIKKQPDINFSEINEKYSVSKEHCKQFQFIYQSFYSNYEKIKKFLDQSRNINDTNQINTILLSFSEIKSSQDATFSSSLKSVEALMTTLGIISKSKNYMNHYVYSQLRNISKLQAKMHETLSTFTVWNEALSKQYSNFSHLECIHKMPSAYEESLIEIDRRKKFGNSVHSNLNRFSDNLNSMRDDENSKRQIFFEKVFHNLPSTLFQGLKEPLPSFNLSLPPFDTMLPQLQLGGSIGDNYSDSLSSSSRKNNNNNPDVDDEFTVIEGQEQQQQQQRWNTSETSNNEKSKSDLKLYESQKIKSLELKLQSTFLMASKTEEKYKDLLEKSKLFQSEMANPIELKKIEEIKKELEEKRNQISKLSEDLSTLSIENTTSQKTVEILQLKENELQNQLVSLTEENIHLQKTIDDHREEIKNLTASIVSLNDKLHNANAQFSEKNLESMEIKEKLEIKINQLEDKIKFLEMNSEESYIDSTRKLDEIIKEKSEALVKLEHLEQTIAKKTLELETLQEASNETIELLNKEIKDLKEKLDENCSQLELKSRDFELKSIELDQKSQELDLKNRELIEKTIEFQDQLKVYVDQKSIDSNEVQQLLQQNNQLTTTVEVNRKNFEEIQKKLIESTTHSETIQEELNRVTRELNELKQQNLQFKDLSTHLDYAQKDLDDLKLTIKSKDTIIESITTEKEEIIKFLEEKNKNLEVVNIQLNEDLEKKDLAISNLDVDMIHIKTLNQQLENSQRENIETLESKETIIQLLQSQIDLFSKQNNNNATIEQKLKSFQETIESMSKELSELREINSHKDQQIQQLLIDKKNLNDTITTKQKYESAYKDIEKLYSEHMAGCEERENGYKKELEDHYFINSQLQKENSEKDNRISLFESELSNRDQTIAQLNQNNSQLTDSVSRHSKLLLQISKILQPNSTEILQPNLMTHIIQQLPMYKDNCNLLEKQLETITLSNEELKIKIQQMEEKENIDILYKENQINENALLSNFQHSRIAVFLPNKQKHYEALNINCPNYYLSPECVDFFIDQIKNNEPVIGIIFEIKTKTAGLKESFGLNAGTEFHEVLIGRID